MNLVPQKTREAYCTQVTVISERLTLYGQSSERIDKERDKEIFAVNGCQA